MKEQIPDLNQLIKKFKVEIEELEMQKKALEGQIVSKAKKIKIVYDALTLLRQEATSQSTLPLSLENSSQIITESLSEKYKEIGLNAAILDILDNSDYLDANEVFEELIKNGFTSASSNIKRDVYISMYRLAKNNKIISKVKENRKKYTNKPSMEKQEE